ncbi:DUF3718 domain-containing protein [Thalassotalea sediminis]|uniref:DUF3718 domain-containing protein n=1 Tax=Thalassotalea sediminis TaxID=1759089 RepID=UPI002573F4FD|nr:DUF3718 domain-containing protein [Thalassotalea sediminis]
MKLFTTLATVATISFAMVSSVSGVEITSAKLTAGDKSTSTKICMSAASGSRIALLKSVEQSGYSRQYIYKNLACNELPVTDFVAQYGKSPEKINAMLSRGQYKGQVTIQDVVAP